MLAVQRRVARGELSNEAMLAYGALQQKHNIYQQVVQNNINYYLKEHPGAWLVYESGYKKLFGLSGTANVQDTLWAGLLCALCFSGLFAMERKGGMETVLRATPLGRRATVRAKLRQSNLAAIVIAAGTALPHLWQGLRDYGLPALLAPAMSISELEAVPKCITLSDLLLFWLLCRAAACLCMARLTLWLGQKLGSLLAALFVSAVGYCLPALLALSGMSNGIEWLGFYPLRRRAVPNAGHQRRRCAVQPDVGADIFGACSRGACVGHRQRFDGSLRVGGRRFGRIVSLCRGLQISTIHAWLLDNGHAGFYE